MPNPSFRTDFRQFLATLLCCALALPFSQVAEAARPSSGETQEAVIVSKQALDYYLRSNYAIAVELYAKAYSLDPKPEYLYGQARAEHDAGLFEAAIGHFERCLAALGPSDQLRVKADHYLKKAQEALAAKKAVQPVKPEVKPEVKPDVKPEVKPDPKANVKPQLPQTLVNPLAPQQPVAWRRPAGWGALGVGVAGIVTATIVGLGAVSDQTDLDKATGKKNAQGLTTGISFDAALARQKSINSRITTGWIVGGVGIAAALAGGFLLASTPSARVAIGPGPGDVGVNLALRF